MKLKDFAVRNFRSIWDSNIVDVDDRITCLVGKNESGKTALLQALYKTHPIVYQHSGFDPTFDYPKREVSDYEFNIESEASEPSLVVKVRYALEEEDQAVIAAIFGPRALREPILTHRTYYGASQHNNKLENNKLDLDLDHNEAIKHLAQSEELSDSIRQNLQAAATWQEFLKNLEEAEDTDAVNRLRTQLGPYSSDDLNVAVADELLWPRCPKFMYFDEYYQLAGSANIDALIQRQDDEELLNSDHPLLGLISLARLRLDQLSSVTSTTDLKNKLEGAGNHLTSQVVTHWSQNKHIQMRFDVRDAKSGDPEGMRDGVNIWGEVYDTVHMASTPLDSRSRGFVWFFSFLAWYEDIKRRKQDVILLLDEPGLSLHGRAQGDLLRYFEKELTDRQIIYTTHSPFMIEPRKLERVRIVQDRGIDSQQGLQREEDGTKVHTDVFDATSDSLFPLQGALGYDIQQSLLVASNTLLVEGPSDILYLQVLSDQMERCGKPFLSRKWAIVPVGGVGKVSVFASLLGAQKHLNVVALLDVAKDRRVVDRIYERKILAKRNVLTYADFLETDEADVEDLFEREFYVDLVNKEFERDLSSTIDPSSLGRSPRIVPAIERYVKENQMLDKPFSHYRPARFLMENSKMMWEMVSEQTQERFARIFVKLNGLLK